MNDYPNFDKRKEKFQKQAHELRKLDQLRRREVRKKYILMALRIAILTLIFIKLYMVLHGSP